MSDTAKKQNENDVTDCIIISLARWLLPQIQAYYNNTDENKSCHLDYDYQKTRSSREA